MDYLYLLILLLVPLFFYILLCYLFHERVGSFDLTSARCLITGGSSGIGLATAKLLAKNGARAITIMARRQQQIDEAIAAIRAESSTCVVYGVSCDVSSLSSVRESVSCAVAHMGGLNVVVCSAGISNPKLFVNMEEEEFKQLIEVNYMGVVHVLKRCVPHLMSVGGRIVLVSSMAGLSGVAGYTGYSASKFALRGLAEALHMELKPFNVAVSLCNPPDVDTPMLAKENESKPEECKLISEGSGVFTAEHIAAAIVSGITHWKFLINSGFDGHLLSLLCCGTAPAHSTLFSVLEAVGVGAIRVISLAYRAHYNNIVKRVHNKKLKENGEWKQKEEEKKKK